MTLTLRPLARKQLGMIYDYCYRNWNKTVAENAIEKIEHIFRLLPQYPHLGCPDHTTSKRYTNLRSIVEGYYRIIYFVDEERERIVIVAIFDTRQNPDKLTIITE